MSLIRRDPLVDVMRVGPLNFQGFSRYGKFSLHPGRDMHYQRHVRLGRWTLTVMRLLDHTHGSPSPTLRFEVRGKRHEFRVSLRRPVDQRFRGRY